MDLLKVERFVTKPRDVEAVRWDGTVESAAGIIAWIKSKGENAVLQRAGEPSDYQPGLPGGPRLNRENYISIGGYLNAQTRAPWIVWEADRYDWRPDQGDFDLCSDEQMAQRYIGNRV